VDSAPDELVQVVGYLQAVTDKVDIDLVTVVAYDVAGSRVLVPQRIEPARRVREVSDAQVIDRQACVESAGWPLSARPSPMFPLTAGTCWNISPTGPTCPNATAW
jgi:hypothetical protein